MTPQDESTRIYQRKCAKFAQHRHFPQNLPWYSTKASKRQTSQGIQATRIVSCSTRGDTTIPHDTRPRDNHVAFLLRGIGVQIAQAKGIGAIHILLLLMEEILHHMGCIKPYKNGINYLSTGAGFLPSPSTVGKCNTHNPKVTPTPYS